VQFIICSRESCIHSQWKETYLCCNEKQDFKRQCTYDERDIWDKCVLTEEGELKQDE